MYEEAQDQFPQKDNPSVRRSSKRQILWFLPHLVAVYLTVKFAAPWLAGWTRRTLLPLLQSSDSSSRLEFFYSHLFVFSLIPGFVFGLANAKFKHKAAQYVWLVPGLILAYRLITFPSSSLFQSGLSAAFHEYFGGGFIIPEFRSYQELWSMVGSNSDIRRGMTQMLYTAPLYAGAGYSFAAWISLRTDVIRKVKELIRRWEDERFEPSSNRNQS